MKSLTKSWRLLFGEKKTILLECSSKKNCCPNPNWHNQIIDWFAKKPASTIGGTAAAAAFEEKIAPEHVIAGLESGGLIDFLSIHPPMDECL